MRLRNNPNALKLLMEYEDVFVPKPQLLKGKWRGRFGNDNKICAELGMGRGRFISTHAHNDPDSNFIGIDVKDEVVLDAMERVAKLKLKNLVLIVSNIADIEEIFAPGELDTLFINFSDPWPKTRHAKRRLTNRLFLNKYKNVLKPGGYIIFKTDSRELFDFSLNEFSECGFELVGVTYDLQSENDPANVVTEYENRFMKKGIPINRLIARYNG